MSVESELRKQTELMRRNTQVQRINSLYGRGKGGSYVPGGGDLSKLTKEDWEHFRYLVNSGQGDEAQKFLDKKSGVLPWFVPPLIWIGVFAVIYLLYAWHVFSLYG